MSKDTTETAETQTPEQAVEAVLSSVDLDKVTPEQVFDDILQQTKMHAMRLMIAVALLEKLAAKDKGSEAENPDLQVVDSPSE